MAVRPLAKVMLATVAAQVAIVMASLTVPVLASAIGPAIGAPAYLVGYYSALIYGTAVATSLATPRLLGMGGVRLHQGMLVLTGFAMLALLPAVLPCLALSALLLGLAYGPMNPASTVLLARYTPAETRARIFSLKQTAVPVGGALAGFGAPLAAGALGWRGAVGWVAAVCFAVAALLQVWRVELDRDRGLARRASANFWLPLRVLIANPGIRAVTAASLVFGAVQFSFAALFPTVLVHAGWRLREAGSALSVALVVGVVCRVLWGAVADRVGSRPILGMMGLMMSLAALAAAGVGPGWPGVAVLGLAALFGLSAYCWAGVAIAETVRQVPAQLVPEASAGLIATTFLGALAGPALFSTATAFAGSLRAGFLVLAAISAAASLLLFKPRG